MLESWQPSKGRYKFSKLLIFFRKLQHYHWQQLLLVVSLEVTGSLHFDSLLAMVCQLFFQVNIVFYEKSHSSQINLTSPSGDNCHTPLVRT